MTTCIKTFNALLTGLFNGLLWPLRGLAPIWGMVFISLLAGLLMLWIFGKISNQEAIKRIKDRIRGNMIGVRLFQDDLRVVFRLQRKILRLTLTYLRHCLTPIAVLLIPFVLIILQLELNFSVRPLRAGETAVVELHQRDGEALNGSVELEVLPGGQAGAPVVETPAVRMPSENEVAWRIRAGTAPGRYTLRARVGNEEVEKELVVGNDWGTVSAVRSGGGWFDLLRWPGEAPIPPSAGVVSMEVSYPTLSMPLFDWYGWLIWFLILSIAFGFAFKGFFGIEV